MIIERILGYRESHHESSDGVDRWRTGDVMMMRSGLQLGSQLAEIMRQSESIDSRKAL